MRTVRARPSELRGALINKICRKEPVCLKCSEGLVNKIYRKEPVCLKCSKGLANVNSESSSICVEGRARR